MHVCELVPVACGPAQRVRVSREHTMYAARPYEVFLVEL
jgi:hypothetical protein